MTKKRTLAAFTVVFSLIGTFFGPSLALAENSSSPGAVTGLIVHFKPGVKAGSPGATSIVSTSATGPMTEVKALGGGLHLVSFETPTSLGFAQTAAAIVSSNPNVLSVSLDHSLTESGITPKSASSGTPILKLKSTQPTRVRAIHVSDAWSSANPRIGALRISWKTPISLAGGKLVGYRLTASIDGGVSFLAFKSTRRNMVSANNLTPGKKYYFRIYAVVKKGRQLYRGLERMVSAIATASPRAPVLNTPQLVFGSTTVSWQPQDPQQKGGLLTTYRVKATSGDETIGCQTAFNSCSLQLENLSDGYRISVIASNSKGSSVSHSIPSPIDSLYGDQWYLNGQNGINAENAWAATEGDSEVTVAVIDTGVTRHADFSNSLLKNDDGLPYGYDFVGNSASSGDSDGWDPDPSDPGDYSALNESSWHGTQVTGIIAAVHNNFGIAGIAPNVKILSVRALGSDGGSLSDFLAAVTWSAGLHVPGVEDNLHPAQVINISIASDSTYLCDVNAQTVFRHASEAGAVIVTAAGNSSTDVKNSFPANCPGVLSVAATSFEGDLTSYSNFGSHISIAAPGGNGPVGSRLLNAFGILSTSNTGKTIPLADNYSAGYGTSYSAPMVTAAVALMLSVNKKLSESDISTILRESATKFGSSSNCFATEMCGPGILNVAGAVELADMANFR